VAWCVCGDKIRLSFAAALFRLRGLSPLVKNVLSRQNSKLLIGRRLSAVLAQLFCPGATEFRRAASELLAGGWRRGSMWLVAISAVTLENAEE
jgi:hypothetical protein